MARFTGVLRKNELEGGFWELLADDGARYQIKGGDAGLRRDGLRVELSGQIDEGGVGIGMTGPILAVSSYKVL